MTKLDLITTVNALMELRFYEHECDKELLKEYLCKVAYLKKIGMLLLEQTEKDEKMTEQTKPTEVCPVCGRDFERDGSFWQCFDSAEDYHIISGPLKYPTGEKIDAMVRGMRGDKNQRERDRLEIAKAALAGLLADYERDGGTTGGYVNRAVEFADALLSELEKSHD